MANRIEAPLSRKLRRSEEGEATTGLGLTTLEKLQIENDRMAGIRLADMAGNGLWNSPPLKAGQGRIVTPAGTMMSVESGGKGRFDETPSLSRFVSEQKNLTMAGFKDQQTNNTRQLLSGQADALASDQTVRKGLATPEGYVYTSTPTVARPAALPAVPATIQTAVLPPAPASLLTTPAAILPPPTVGGTPAASTPSPATVAAAKTSLTQPAPQAAPVVTGPTDSFGRPSASAIGPSMGAAAELRRTLGLGMTSQEHNRQKQTATDNALRDRQAATADQEATARAQLAQNESLARIDAQKRQDTLAQSTIDANARGAELQSKVTISSIERDKIISDAAAGRVVQPLLLGGGDYLTYDHATKNWILTERSGNMTTGQFLTDPNDSSKSVYVATDGSVTPLRGDRQLPLPPWDVDAYYASRITGQDPNVKAAGENNLINYLRPSRGVMPAGMENEFQPSASPSNSKRSISLPAPRDKKDNLLNKEDAGLFLRAILDGRPFDEVKEKDVQQARALAENYGWRLK